MFSYIAGILLSNAVFIGILYFLKDRISEYLTARMKSKFEKEIEVVRSNLRKEEAQLSELRAAILSARGERRSLLERKRIDAAETIWKRAQLAASMTFAVNTMRILNTEAISKMPEDERQKVSDFVKTITVPLNVDKYIQDGKEFSLSTDRLYVSPEVWAYFSAYTSVISSALMRLKLLELLPGDQNLMTEGYLEKIILELIPEAKDGFEKFGESYAYYQHDILYERLLLELKKFIDGASFDEEEMKRAQEISILASKGLPEKAADIPEELKNPNLPQ